MNKVFIEDKQGNKVLPITHVSAVFDDGGNDLDSHLGNFEDEVRGLVDTPHQEYVTVATYASLPPSGSKDTIYRVSNYDGSQSQVADDVYSEYAWDGSQYVHLSTKTQIGEVFDISAYHASGGTLAKYADLSAALGTNGANIPESLRKGGMSVKFVLSSDNIYVQFRCIADEFTIDVTKWQKLGAEVSVSQNALAKSTTITIGDESTTINPIEDVGGSFTDTDVDLEFSDESGEKSIVKFKDGDLETKNFNSKNTPQSAETVDADLSLNDESNHKIAEFFDGEFRTKEFDSRTFKSKDNIRFDYSIEDKKGNAIITVNEGYPKTKNFDGKEIKNKLSTVSVMNSFLPLFFIPYLDDKIATIENRLIYSNVGDAYIFLTDTHVFVNAGQSGKMIGYLMQRSNINKCFFGGDIVRAYGDKDDILDDMKVWRENWYRHINPQGKLYPMLGNHDFTIRESAGSQQGYTYSMSVARNYTMRRLETEPQINISDNTNAMYYYIDNKSMKIRYIVLNTSDDATDGEYPWGTINVITEAQLLWLKESLLSLESGYGVVIFCHIPPYNPTGNGYSMGDYSNIVNLLSAYQNKTGDFVSANGKILYVQSGHVHFDGYTVKDGVLYVTTAMDAISADYKAGMFGIPSDYPLKVEGDFNEQTFDVGVINKTSKIADLIRIGGGYTRRLHLNEIEVEVGNNIEVIPTLQLDAVWMCCDNIGNSLNGYVWTYSDDVCSVTNGVVRGLATGEALVCAKDESKKIMEIFTIKVV